MPAQKDETAWEPVEGDHADDQSYERVHQDPTEPPTDEKRTAAEVEETKKKK